MTSKPELQTTTPRSAYQEALMELLLSLPPLPPTWEPGAVGAALHKALVAYEKCR